MDTGASIRGKTFPIVPWVGKMQGESIFEGWYTGLLKVGAYEICEHVWEYMGLCDDIAVFLSLH